jgi:hypothetical protein
MEGHLPFVCIFTVDQKHFCGQVIADMGRTDSFETKKFVLWRDSHFLHLLQYTSVEG